MKSIRLRHTKLAHKTNKIISSLPDKLYLAIYPILLSAVNKNRRHINVIFRKKANNLFLAQDSTYGDIYFYEKTRMELYCWINGISKRLMTIRGKYQLGNVRVRPGDTVVDVGANIGEFSLSISGVAKRIFAFEPDPVPYACLNLNSQNYCNIHPEKIAISNQTSKVKFYLASKTADSSIIEPDVPYDQTIVETMTLDDIFFNKEKIDFLKIEAEGWEPEVLRGATQLLSTSVRCVAVDAGPERYGESTAHEVSKILREHNFEVISDGDMVYAHRCI